MTLDYHDPAMWEEWTDEPSLTEPIPCPECGGCMDPSGRVPVCPSCRAMSEADRLQEDA